MSIPRIHAPRSSKGFIGATVLAWCLVLSACAAAMAAVSMESSRVAELDWLASRAQSASDAGLIWGRGQAMAGSCQALSTFSGASAMPGFPDMSVEVSCSQASSSEESGSQVLRLDISARACSSSQCPMALPKGSYAERAGSLAVWR